MGGVLTNLPGPQLAVNLKPKATMDCESSGPLWRGGAGVAEKVFSRHD